MTSLDQSIVAAWETGGAGVEDIAREFKLLPEVVRFALMAHSREFRKSVDAGEESAFSGEERVQIQRHLKHLAFKAEDESTQLRAAIYLNEEMTGRNTAKSRAAGNAPVNINILAMQESIAKAIAQRDAALGSIIVSGAENVSLAP